MTDPAHPSAQRLLDFAVKATADTPHQIHDWRDLLIRLQVSPGVMTNWKRRGVSKPGALQAEHEFGCSASWVLSGQGDQAPKRPTADGGRVVPFYFAEQPDSPADALSLLAHHLGRAPRGMLEPIADVLAAWARTAGRDKHRYAALLQLLSSDEAKRKSVNG